MKSRDESLLSVWGRRALTVPSFLALAALALVTIPIWAIAGLAWDVLTGRASKIPRTRTLAFFALYLGCEAAGVLGAAFLWLFALGGRIGGPRRWVAMNAALQRWWSGTLFSCTVRLFSMKVVVERPEPPLRGPLLLFVRHASTADAVLAAALVANPAKLLLRYVLKRALLWDPCLDIVGRRLPNAFVDRRSPGPAAAVAAVASLAVGLDEHSGVLIYPEGTRFSEAKLVAAVASLRDKGKVELASIAGDFRNVLPPRLGGPLALLSAAEGVDVVILAHTGFERVSSFAKFWKEPPVKATLHVRLQRIPAATIPTEGRDRWLFERWAEMDRWISELRGAGSVKRSGS
ncbi:MAG: 1-acyl-sn-glycerol-3-phosphate acyltransferase [Thermoanaerobaculia bacterium]